MGDASDRSVRRAVVGRRILGIDPGSLVTGWGIVESWKFVKSCGLRHHRDGGRPSARCSVKPHLQRHSANHRASSSGRRQSGEGFFARNPQSALKLGQARGVALLAAAENQLDVYEYSSNEIKSAVVGMATRPRSKCKKWSRRCSMFRRR